MSSSSDSGPVTPLPPPSPNGPRRYPEGSEGLDTLIEGAKFYGLRGDYPPTGFANLSGAGLPAAVKQILQDMIKNDPTLKQRALTIYASKDRNASPLPKALEILEFKEIEMRFDLDLDDPRPGGEQPFSYGGPRLSFTKRDGAFFVREKLSHGQKRMFGFLWYLACSEQVAIADELSNGMHYAMAQAALEAIGERQAFLAIQDPMLLDPLTFDSAEEVALSFVSCSTVQDGGRERWRWASFTEDQARTFFDAYEVGIQHVSRILHTWELW